MDIITRDTVLAFFDAAADIMNEKKQHLINLDAALGDGDLGLTMSTGFETAKKTAHSSAEADLGKLFMQVGMAIAKAAPSSMGTLVGSGFMRSAKALKGKTEMTADDLALFMREFVSGLMDRGKTKPGDRTIIDALEPAARALEQSAHMGLFAAADAAVQAAEAGVEATKGMLAAVGRGVFYGDQVLGKPDQGAVVGLYIMNAWRKAIV